jgi:hypothetical protein
MIYASRMADLHLLVARHDFCTLDSMPIDQFDFSMKEHNHNESIMDFRILDPSEHPAWDELLLLSNNPVFFHTAGWARALKVTYRFRPTYFVIMKEGRLGFLMPFMEVSSALTGLRGVSLPFTDQCSVYSPNKSTFDNAVQEVIRFAKERRWHSIEWRDPGYFDERFPPSEAYYAHDIDLTQSEHGLFAALSDSNRRNIKKATKEKVIIRFEKSLDSVRDFYKLNLITRRRHGLPPQPFAFFKNIFEQIILKDQGIVVTASHQGKMIAASVYFHFGKKALYKYGASEMKYQNLRPNNLIMWEALRWYNKRGFETLNLGRTELNNPGLLQFKRTWGGKESLLKYYRYEIGKMGYTYKTLKSAGFLSAICARTPTIVLRIVGRILYRHMG